MFLTGCESLRTNNKMSLFNKTAISPLACMQHSFCVPGICAIKSTS
jgi:hypothetical protein